MIPDNKKRPSEKFLAQHILFLGEQDGSPERVLKTTLINFFIRDRSVEKAYLARIEFGSKDKIGVALCLRTQFGADNGLVEKIGTIFASVFNAQEHLDIIFLTSQQENDAQKVCQPFFKK